MHMYKLVRESRPVSWIFIPLWLVPNLCWFIISRARQLQSQDHPAQIRWTRGADLPLHDPGLGSIFDRSSASLGQDRQAEMDACLLTL